MITELPSEKLLEEIGFKENGLSYLVRLSPSKDSDFIASYFSGYIETIKEYYRNIFDKEDSKFKEFCKKLYADSEALNNAYRHNKENSDSFHQIIFGSKGLCSGFKNDTDYFRNEEIKRLYESKILPKKNNAGTEIIYNSDKIEVDTNQGVLYLFHIIPN